MGKLKVVSKKEFFNVADDRGILIQVEARRTEIDGVPCFINFDDEEKLWIISHLESGCRIADGKTKMEAGTSAFIRLMNDKSPLEKIKNTLIEHGFQYPINKI